MISRIEALIERENEYAHGRSYNEHCVLFDQHARQLLPLMLEVVKAGDRAYEKSTREENGYVVSKREMLILIRTLDELEGYCLKHLPTDQPTDEAAEPIDGEQNGA